MKAAVSILLRLFQTPLFTLENPFAAVPFDPYRIFDEAFDGNLIESRHLLENSPGLEIDATLHLVFYALKNLLLISLLLIHTYYALGAFKGRENRARKFFRASTSDVLAVLTMNFLSKMRSALTRGSRRSCTGFLNWFVK